MTFDSSTIYCLATGKPIATISDDEFGVILESVMHIPVVEQAMHLERLALSSMRPSLAFMSVTPALLDNLRTAAPRQLLAYLLNRMYAPIDLPKFGNRPVPMESWLQARRTRIAIWESIESAEISDTHMDQLLFVLLELDSRFNLCKLTKPTAIAALWQDWSAATSESLIKLLWDWRADLVADQIKKDKLAKASAEFWSEGNRLTRNALTQQFKKVTPPSRTAVAKAEKAEKHKDAVDFLDQLEAELTSQTKYGTTPTAQVAAAPVPVAPKAPVRLMRFGAKKIEESK